VIRVFITILPPIAPYYIPSRCTIKVAKYPLSGRCIRGRENRLGRRD
jgi:hypothetical protein